MSGMIVSARDKRGLVAGLQWQTLFSTGRTRSKEIRQHAKAVGASKVLLFDAGHSVTVGLYVPNELADIVLDDDGAVEAKTPTKLHSLAAAFAKFVGASSAVLVYELQDGRAAVCSITGGIPISDGVFSAEEAQKMANRYASGTDDSGVSHEVYTNNGNTFRGHPISDQQIWEHVNGSTVLGSAPANVLGLIALIALLAMAGGGYFAYDSWSKAKAAEKRRLEAKAADPRPKYMQALNAQMLELGVAREDMVQALGQVLSQRVYVAGWGLQEVSCSARSQECLWTWQRDTGTTLELSAALREQGFQPRETAKLETASFTSSFKPPLAGLNDVSEFVTIDQAAIGNVHTLQLWDNAGVPAPSMAAYTLWPTVTGVDMRKMPVSEAVKTRPFTVAAPLGWARDIIRSAPADVWWTDFKITVGGETADVTINLVGASYVY